ncbi:MAG TPA: SurA N-terminal domain-containing protein [Methylomirabilota bacterium]|nr:SurA N-terminal domain-containing protein [Methylomirabilota bacterium]
MRRYRRGLQVGLLIVIAAFIASLFVFGATGGRDGVVAPDSVATVNGESISQERYHRRYQEYLNLYQQTLRERFSPDLAERMGMPRQVVDDLVQETLVAQRARAEGLEVDDEELNAQIHAMPAFQDGGRFTLKRYEDVLRRLGYNKTSFEDDMRRRLTRLKVESMVRGAVRVSDTELEQAYTHMREEVRAAWALVETAPLATAATATDAELETYLQQHGAEFRLPERRRVQYVAVDPKDFATPPADAEVEKYYAEHAAEFEQPPQVRAAHILVRVPETGGSEAEDQARAKVADAIRRVKAGEDFGKMAREMSQDPTTGPRGGDLGFVSRGEVVKPFEEALFALKKGEITAEPVRTPFGFHAIKVDDVRPGGKKTVKEVAPQIRERLKTQAADAAAKARADEIRAKLLGAADFMAEARKLGLAPVESTIPRREPEGFAPPDTMEETAFGLTRGGVSTPLKTPAGFVVLKAAETLPAAVPPLAEVKDRVAAAVKLQKAEAEALARARRVLTEAKAGDLAAAARAAGATAGETPRFSRAKPAERLPGDAMLAALKTPVGALTEPVKTPQGYYVLKTLERVPPDMAGLAAERDKVAAEVLGRKQSQAWEAWLAGARTKAKIDVSSRLPSRRG